MKKKRHNKKHTKAKLIAFAGITAAVTIGLYAWSQVEPKAAATETFTVTRRDLVRTEGLSGTAVFADSDSIICSEEYPVKEVFVKAGDTVKTGDRLFSYDTSEIDLLISEYTLKLLDMEKANEEGAAKLSEASAYSGDMLKNAVKAAESAYSSGILQCEAIRERLERYVQEQRDAEEMRGRLIEEMEAETDELRLQQLEAEYQIYSEKADKLAALAEETRSNAEKAEAALGSLRSAAEAARHELEKNSAQNQQKEALQKLNKELERSYRELLDGMKRKREELTVYSPRPGIVSECICERNMRFFNERVITISDPDDLSVRLELPADKLGAVKKGMKGLMTTNDKENSEIEGIIADIVYEADGKYSLMMEISESDKKLLRQGMKVYASIILEECSDTLAVPYEAILKENGGSYVLVMDEGTPLKTQVHEIMDSGYFIAVSSQQLTENSVILADAENYPE